MRLDKAIKHARDKANEQRYYSQFEKVRNSCIKCAEEYEQLVNWLEELKELREVKAIYQKGMDCSYATFMYNQAIDDCIKKIIDTPSKIGTHLKEPQRVDTCLTMLADRQNEIIDLLVQLKECAE